jgi:hypothetical protein
VHTFEFTLPCVDKGNPYQVTTKSDATVTIQKTLATSGRHSEMILGFTDVGTYKAIPKRGSRPISGWFFDTYTTVAKDAKTGPDGTVTTAAHATNRRVLVLSNSSEGEFFRENISVDADNYNAVTTPVTDDVTCGQKTNPK